MSQSPTDEQFTVANKIAGSESHQRAAIILKAHDEKQRAKTLTEVADWLMRLRTSAVINDVEREQLAALAGIIREDRIR